MGRFALLPVILAVATVDDPAVLICGVPNLSSEIAAARTAPNFPRENTHAAVSPAFPCVSLHLPLYHLEGGRVDDGRMALFYEVARHLPTVLDGFLGEEIRREGLLDSRTACVFLIGENALNGLSVPFLFARNRQDATPSQFLGDGAGCQPLDE